MKSTTHPSLRQIVLAAAVLASPLQAANLWWDTNGNTAGAGGTSPSGTWDANTTANWSTNSAGTATTQTYGGVSNSVRFAAGTDATGSYTVTIDGSVAVTHTNDAGANPGVIVEEGNVTLTGGTIGGSSFNQHYHWDVASGSTLTVSSTLANTGGGGTFQKDQGGTMIINGTDERQTHFRVLAGTLLYNTSSHTNATMTVFNGATLGGTGTMNKTTTINAGGTLAPGAGGVGTFTVGDNLTLADGALFNFELGTPAASGLVSMNSHTLTLNNQEWADFTFTALTGFGAGDYTLFDANAISGSLGSTVSGTIDSLGGTLWIDGITNNLMLTVIPEPRAALLGGLGLLALLRRRRAF